MLKSIKETKRVFMGGMRKNIFIGWGNERDQSGWMGNKRATIVLFCAVKRVTLANIFRGAFSKKVRSISVSFTTFDFPHKNMRYIFFIYPFLNFRPLNLKGVFVGFFAKNEK